MANQEQLDILKRGVKEWNQWRIDNPETQIDFKGADLSNRILTGGYFSRADFTYAILRNVDLSFASLSEANFAKSDLQNANFLNADLRWAYMRGANLDDANLLDADFYLADLAYAIVSQEQLQTAINVSSQFLKHGKDESSRKIEIELENSNKRLREKEEELKKIAEEKAQLTSKQLVQKESLENEIERLKKEGEYKENELQTIKNELVARAKDSEDFKIRLNSASEEIKKPYKYLQYEIWFENALCVVFVVIAIISFYYLCQFVCHISYDERITKVYTDKDFNFYKLFFVISPVIYYLGLCSTFMTLAFKRRQNVRELESRQQEINHITGILSAYTTIREDEEIIHAKEFAREAISLYLKKVIGAKESKDEKENEKVDFMQPIYDLKNQITQLRSDLKKGD